MEAYQDLRQERARILAYRDQYYADTTLLPPGPLRDARDAILRAEKQYKIGDFHDQVLKGQWDNIGKDFAYSASDAVADWWASWGMLAERAKKRAEVFLQIEMKVDPQGTAV